MKKGVLLIFAIISFFYCNETLDAMISSKEDVTAYHKWLKEGNKGTFIQFLKSGFPKKVEEVVLPEKLAQDKAELENQLRSQESKLALLQKQLDDLLKAKGTASTEFALRSEDPRIKTLEKEVADLHAEVERFRKLGAGVGAGEREDPRIKKLEEDIAGLRAEVERLRKVGAGVGVEESESLETIFWRGKAADVVVELQRRLEQIREYQKEAEEALEHFKQAPHEQDQDVLLQYFKNLKQAVKDSQSRIIELNDIKFDDKLSNANVRVPKGYRDFSNTLEILLDRLTKVWRPQQFFGFLPWIATDTPIKNRIDELRKLNMSWDKTQQHLNPAIPYNEIPKVSLEISAVPPSAEKEQEGQEVPPPPPPPAPSVTKTGKSAEPKVETKETRQQLLEEIRKRRKD